MSITLINTSQILDYRNPTGQFHSTGLTFLNGLNISGTTSGNSGNYQNFSVQNLDVSGAIRSPYLSGILGISVTGSGIVQFLSQIDTSGNNLHFILDVHTGNRNFPIYRASSSDSQAGWTFYDDSFSWQNMPAIGLSSTQQDSSIIRHVFSPTGLSIYNQLFVEVRPLFAGNVTGNYTNSYNFIPNANGFHVGMLTNLEELFNTADSRYVRKIQQGTEFIPSGVVISGVPIVVQGYTNIPVDNHGTGTLIQVSGQLYNWNETIGFSGYQLVSNITGLTVPSGGAISSPLINFAGDGGIATYISGNTIIVSGGSSSQFGIATQSFNNGNIIFSGEGGLSIRSGTTSTGTVIIFSGGGGGGSSVGISGLQVKTGSTILTNSNVVGVPLITGVGRNSNIRIGNPIAIGGGPFSFSVLDIADVFLHGNGTTRQRIYGPFAWSGAFFEKIVGQTFTAYDGFTDGVDDTNNVTILKFHPLVTGISVNNSGVLTSGGFTFTGAGNITVSATPTARNTTQIIISGTSSSGGGGVGNVTGFGTNFTLPLYTGGFLVTGAGNITATLTNLGNNVSGFLISGSSSSNANGVTGIGSNGGVGQTGYVSISGASNITVLQQGNNFVISGLSAYVTGIGITGLSPSYLSGGIALIGTGATTITYSGNNIVIGSSSGSTTVNNNTNNFFLSGNQGIVSAGISGIPQFTGTMGITGLGGITVSLDTTNSYGFSGLFQISGRVPIGSYFFVFPSTIDTVSNNLIPDLYADEANTGYEFAATLKTACQGQSILGFFNKNGSSLFNFEVPTGITKFTSGINISIASGDVITAGLTQVGSTTAGTTLAVSINVK